MLWFILIFFIIAIGIAVGTVYNASQKRKALAEALSNLAGFIVSQSYLDDSGNTAIAVDDSGNNIYLLKHCGDRVKTRVVPYRDILSAEDTSEPVHLVNFLEGEYKTDSFLYRHAMEQASHWQALLSVLITRADREDKSKE